MFDQKHTFTRSCAVIGFLSVAMTLSAASDFTIVVPHGGSDSLTPTVYATPDGASVVPGSVSGVTAGKENWGNDICNIVTDGTDFFTIFDEELIVSGDAKVRKHIYSTSGTGAVWGTVWAGPGNGLPDDADSFTQRMVHFEPTNGYLYVAVSENLNELAIYRVDKSTGIAASVFTHSLTDGNNQPILMGVSETAILVFQSNVVGTEFYVHRSENGVSWSTYDINGDSKLTNGVVGKFYWPIAYDATDGRWITVVKTDARETQLMASDDDGREWTLIGPTYDTAVPNVPIALAADGQGNWLALRWANGYRTNDNGTTVDTSDDYIEEVDDGSTGIYWSQNRGVDWQLVQEVDLPTVNRDMQDLIGYHNDFANPPVWVVGAGDGQLWTATDPTGSPVASTFDALGNEIADDSNFKWTKGQQFIFNATKNHYLDPWQVVSPTIKPHPASPPP